VPLTILPLHTLEKKRKKSTAFPYNEFTHPFIYFSLLFFPPILKFVFQHSSLSFPFSLSLSLSSPCPSYFCPLLLSEKFVFIFFWFFVFCSYSHQFMSFYLLLFVTIPLNYLKFFPQFSLNFLILILKLNYLQTQIKY
jgi:hypothetical protein